MTQTVSSGLDELRATMVGAALLFGDPGYDDARSIWNGEIDRRPAVIARCESGADVVAAVGFAQRAGLEIAVRGGGHAFSGSSVCEGGLMIDLSRLRGVRVDADRRRVVVGGGATLADLDAATQAHGLAVPSGVISHTGVGGLTLGGGMGWLTNKHGLSIDNLRAAQVVLADGRVVRASTDEHPDLFWALRGGGGNFGVVTEFEFRAHPVGPLVHLALLFWGLDQGREALRACRDTIPTLPEGTGAVIAAGLSAPGAPFVPERYRLTPGHALMVVGFGSARDHARAIAPLRHACPPRFEFVTPIPYTGLQQMLDPTAPWGIHAYEKGLDLDELTDEAITVLVEQAGNRPSPESYMQMARLAGAFSRVPDEDTAFGGSRFPHYVINIEAASTDPERRVAGRAWVRSTWEALRPLARTSGSYVNFMAELDHDRVRAAYGAKYDLLAAIKTTYDPGNVFHRNINIKPA